MAETKVKANANGPYLLTGAVELLDSDGKPYPLEPGKAVALCRCGGSSNKPFCDGTHSKVGFVSTCKVG